MHEQNSFSNLNTPDRGEAIISSSAEQKSIPAAGNNFGAIAPSQPPKDKKPLDLKVIFIAIAAALVGAGIAVAVVLIVNNLNNREEGETTEITYSSPDNDGTKQNEEVIAEKSPKPAIKKLNSGSHSTRLAIIILSRTTTPPYQSYKESTSQV